jgi:hypothetical protein
MIFFGIFTVPGLASVSRITIMVQPGLPGVCRRLANHIFSNSQLLVVTTRMQLPDILHSAWWAVYCELYDILWRVPVGIDIYLL